MKLIVYDSWAQSWARLLFLESRILVVGWSLVALGCSCDCSSNHSVRKIMSSAFHSLRIQFKHFAFIQNIVMSSWLIHLHSFFTCTNSAIQSSRSLRKQHAPFANSMFLWSLLKRRYVDRITIPFSRIVTRSLLVTVVLHMGLHG